MNSHDYDVDDVEDSLTSTAIGTLIGASIGCAVWAGAIFYIVGAW